MRFNPQKPEYILCSAIRNKIVDESKPDIYNYRLGYRHCDIIAKYNKDLSIEFDDQGFFTSEGRFVNRKEAAKIAYNAGQIPEAYDTLYSEDLY